MRCLLAVLMLLGLASLPLTAASVVAVTTTNPTGPESPGDIVTVIVIFDSNVTVSGGIPQLYLNAQPGGNLVAMTSGSGTTELEFTYTVALGDLAFPLDVRDANSLITNGSQILDSTGHPAILTLPTPGSQNSLSFNNNISVYTGPAASIVKFTSPNPDGTYGTNDSLTIDVTFSAPVFIVTNQGQPTLTLSSHGTATYQGGSGSSVFAFTYKPLFPEMENSELNVTSFNTATGQLSCSSTTGNTTPNPSTNTAIALGQSGNKLIDTTPPVVQNVTANPTTGVFSIGATIPIIVTFSKPVIVGPGGPPTLTLATGSTTLTDTVISYVSGSGTSSLIYNYVVGPGQDTAHLDYLDASSNPTLLQPFSVNGSTIRDLASNDVDFTQTPLAGNSGSLGANTHIEIDTMQPSINTVTTEEAANTYSTGTIHILVNFTEGSVPVAMNATGSPTLMLNNTNMANNLATFSLADTTSYKALHPSSAIGTLVFDYVIKTGDEASLLNYTSVLDLKLNGGSITDAAGNAALLNLPALTSSAALQSQGIVIDTPAAVDLIDSTSAAGTFIVNAVIPIQVHYSKPVTVTGTPELQLNSGSGSHITFAIYQSGGPSPSQILTFTYTVAAGDVASPLDTHATSALLLNGGTIQDGSIAAGLTLPAPGSAQSLSAVGLIIDGIVPVITSISSPQSPGIFTIGQTVSIVVTFNEPVVVSSGAAPLLAVNMTTSAGPNAVATYMSGSGTTALTFSLPIAAGENSARLDTSGTTLVFPGATIADLAGNSAAGTLPVASAPNGLAGTSNIVVNTTSPVITTVASSPTNTVYGQGQPIPITVTFSENVTVTTTGGTPTLLFNNGHSATYVSASGATLTFTYQVLPTDTSIAPLNYASTTAFVLNGAVIQDSALNAALLTLPATTATGALATSDVSISVTHPSVVSITSTSSNGIYTTGDVIGLIVTFNVPVVVTGAPTLALNTAPSSGLATYVSGSATTTLSFTYTVVASQNTPLLDASGTNALAGTIADASGDAAALTLPIGTTVGSLALDSTIAIETTAGTAAPGVTSLTSPTANGSYVTGQSVEVDVNFSSPVTVTGSPYVQLNAQGTAPSQAIATYTGGSGSTKLRFSYIVVTGNTTQQLDASETNSLVLAGGTIADPFFSAILTLPQPGTANSLSSSSDIKINADAPSGKPGTDTIGVTPASSGGCGLGGGAALMGLSLLLASRRRTARSLV